MKSRRFGTRRRCSALAVAAVLADRRRDDGVGKSSATPTIVIGAAVDLTSSMKPFDSPGAGRRADRGEEARPRRKGRTS